MRQTTTPVIGLWGCSCHPFKNWEEHNWYARQQYKPGQRVMIRHTGEFAFIVEKLQHGNFNQGNFYRINRLPCKNPCDITTEHASGLVPEQKFTAKQLHNFRKAVTINKQLGLFQPTNTTIGE